MAEAWSPRVEKREHPAGEHGVRSSLEEVAKKATEGSYHPRVRTWAIQMLDEARGRGESVKKPIDRARVLLRAVQQKLWVPDPVGGEYMPGAHLLACDPKNPKDGDVCVRGDDCDGVQILLAAALSSVGIYTMIVGHAYDREQRIEHVLCAAHCDGKWHYADPSTDLPFGKCVTPFSRERLLSMPNVQVLCDERACLSAKTFNPDQMNFVEKGVFVGVDGPPELTLAGLASPLAWLSEAPPRLTWLGQAVLDLKDPKVMSDVKRMMHLLSPTYSSTSATWSASDWFEYRLIADLMATRQNISKEVLIAHSENGQAILGSPSGTIGYPSAAGIRAMGLDLTLTKVPGFGTENDVVKAFPSLSVQVVPNSVGVTEPNFGTEPGKKSGGVSPIVLGLLALGGLGLAIASANRSTNLLENRAREPVDEAAADELLVTLENDARFAPTASGSLGRAVLVNQLKKWRRGTYDPKLGPKAWMYVVDSAAVAYAREFGGNWHQLFNKPTRESVAEELARWFEREAKFGAFDYIRAEA